MTTKTASIVHFYFGENSYMNRLAQETVNLGLALKGYDRSVLLHHETSVGRFEVSKADEKYASVVDIPTKENLVKYINELGSQGYQVDLYVFAHGWDKHFLTSKGIYGDNGSISAAYLEANVKVPCLRAVWQCNCYGATMNPTWLKLGAKAAAGSKFVNFYPTRFAGFSKAWSDGATFGDAVVDSDTALVRTPVQGWMVVDATTRIKEWGGNVLTALTVLGKNTAASAYFSKCWIDGEGEYDTTKSGKQNMNASSFAVISGDRGLLKNG